LREPEAATRALEPSASGTAGRETPPSPRRRDGLRLRALRLLSWWPPFLGAGIRVRRVDRPDGEPPVYETTLRLRRWNANYFGTHFGGSLYSMCDPFFVLALAEALGPGYVVWDKAATIRFRRPGRGTVRARFALSAAELEAIRRGVERDGKVEPTFTAEVRDEAGELIAEVEKLLYVRRREKPVTR
jgi:acyl-coenzyme A thioesterase PaaI-like protein